MSISSSPVGLFGILPIETLCQVVRNLDFESLEQYLLAYPSVQVDVFSCLTRLPPPKKLEKLVPFLMKYPYVSLPLPPDFFGTFGGVRPSNTLDDRGRSGVSVASIEELQVLSRGIRGDLYIQSANAIHTINPKDVRSFMDFFIARALLYPRSLTAIKFPGREKYITISNSLVSYRDGSLALIFPDDIEDIPWKEFRGPVIQALSVLPVTELVSDLGNATIPFTEPELFLLATKGIQTFVSRELIPNLLRGIIKTQTKYKLPYTIKKIILEPFSSTRQPTPGVEEVEGPAPMDIEDAIELIENFPDLRILRYKGDVPVEELSRLYPKISFQHIERRKPQDTDKREPQDTGLVWGFPGYRGLDDDEEEHVIRMTPYAGLGPQDAWGTIASSFGPPRSPPLD